MNPLTTLATAMRALPASFRRVLYTVVTAAGAVLAIAQIAGWKTIGPIDMDTALQTYALVSSPTGFLALANVQPKVSVDDDLDVDLGSFEGSSFDTADGELDGEMDGGLDDEMADEPVGEASFS
jgi:hypothetical protein